MHVPERGAVPEELCLPVWAEVVPEPLRARPEAVHDRAPVVPVARSGTERSYEARGPVSAVHHRLQRRRSGRVGMGEKSVARDEIESGPAPREAEPDIDGGQTAPDQHHVFRLDRIQSAGCPGIGDVAASTLRVARPVEWIARSGRPECEDRPGPRDPASRGEADPSSPHTGLLERKRDGFIRDDAEGARGKRGREEGLGKVFAVEAAWCESRCAGVRMSLGQPFDECAGLLARRRSTCRPERSADGPGPRSGRPFPGRAAPFAR